MIVLPTESTLARYTFTIELDGSEFKLGFEWNDRAAGWFFDLFDSTGAALVSGRRIVVGFPLWNRIHTAGMPFGDLSAIDTSGAGIEPGFADLGNRVLLVYTPWAEIPDNLKVSV